MNRSHISLLAAVALASAAAAASADLLLTKEGATIETAGPWRVDGRRVLFTLPNGQLSSMRTDDVDLDASALATARAAEAATVEEAPAPASAAPILTLTEDDLAKEESSETEGEKEAETETAPAVPLEIVSWEQSPMENDEGVQLFGVVRNNGKSHLTAVSITAVLYGPEGGMLANGDAQLTRSSIPPADTANFRIEFPGLPDFTSVKFSPTARGFESRSEIPEGLEELPPVEGEAEVGMGEGADAASEAASEKAAMEAYQANMKATGDEPPPSEPPPGMY